MDELVREVLTDDDAWFVGGAVRDELLGRRVVDVDVVCRDPASAARAYAKRSGGFPFELSERHSSWRGVLRPRGTGGVTPPHGTLETGPARRGVPIDRAAATRS